MDQIGTFSLLEVYEQKTRHEILNSLIEKGSQGQTLRELSYNLNSPIQTLLWHLRVLEDNNIITKRKIQNELVFIVNDYLEDFDIKLKNFELSFKTVSAKKLYSLLINLEENQIFSLADVNETTSWTTRTSLRYIRKLTDMEFIEKNHAGPGYKLTTKYHKKIQNNFQKI